MLAGSVSSCSASAKAGEALTAQMSSAIMGGSSGSSPRAPESSFSARRKESSDFPANCRAASQRSNSALTRSVSASTHSPLTRIRPPLVRKISASSASVSFRSPREAPTEKRTRLSEVSSPRFFVTSSATSTFSRLGRPLFQSPARRTPIPAALYVSVSRRKSHASVAEKKVGLKILFSSSSRFSSGESAEAALTGSR